MSIKWIVTDMDGTLLNSSERITDRTREALIACQKKGIRLILASGRSYVRLLPYAEQLEMKNYEGCFIEINGLALNQLETQKRTVFSTLERKDIDCLFPVLEQFQVEIQGYEDDTLYYWIPEWQIPLKQKECAEKGYGPEHPLVAGAWSWVTENIHNYPNLVPIASRTELPDRLNKLNCTDREEKIQGVYEYLTTHFGSKYEFVRTGPRLIEIAPQGITKGQTLRRFMEMEGVSPDEVIVFGDGENDVDMFRCVKHSVAMGNAKNYVKKFASDVTLSNDEEGVAAALEKYHVL